MEQADVLLLGGFSLEFLIALGIVLLFGMGWHEYAHAIVADWWGDPTPRDNGRLTPNPFVHIYWPGWLMFVIIGFGILGSVPINPRRMRDPRWGSFWTSLAGPLSNLGMALISAILLRFVTEFDVVFSTFPFIILLLTTSVFFNSLLFVFNLLPFFPIDGWHIVLTLLPGYGMTHKSIPSIIHQYLPPLSRFLQRPAYVWQAWAQVSQYVLLFMIFVSFSGLWNPLYALIVVPAQTIMNLFLGL